MKNPTLLACAFALLLASFSSPGTLYGQRLKDKRIRFPYVSFPEKKLPENFLTYSVNMYGSAMVEGGSNSESAGNRIYMDAFKRVSPYGDKGGGHLRIVVNTGAVIQGTPEFKSQKNTTKDSKTGKETVTYTYWYAVPYSAGPSFQIFDPEGNVLESGGGALSEVKNTQSYSNSNDLTKNYATLLNGLRKSYAAEVTNNMIGRVNGVLAKKYDFRKTYDTPELYLLVNHDTEDDYERYFDQLEQECKRLDAAAPTDSFQAAFKGALDFYKKEAEVNAKGDKKMARVYEAANFNAALLSYYLGDFETAVRYAQRVLDQEEGKHRKAKEIVDGVAEIKKQMEFHKIYSMHYSRDLSNAMAPAAMKALEIAKEEEAAANNTLGGSILLKGQTIEGIFKSEKSAADFDFSENGNTKFVASADNKAYSLSSADIEAFKIGDRQFVRIMFATCIKGKTPAALQIMEEVYSSDKIKLYKHYPTTGATTDGKIEFALKKNAEAEPVSLYDTRFLLLKKGLANYFADCADLKELCEQGEITNDQEGLLKAVRIYAEVCKAP